MEEVKGSQKLIARCRWGNKEEKNTFWLADEKKKCQICKMIEETIEHMLPHIKKDYELRCVE